MNGCVVAGCERGVKIVKRGLCWAHYERWRKYGDPTMGGPAMGRSIEARFWSKVDKSGDCWRWLGYKRDGYGKFAQEHHKEVAAHRFAYENLVGPIPAGLTLDHLCRVRDCVNPDHLEPVTQRENTLRGTSPVAKNAQKTHCIHDHELSGDNLITDKNGGRECRTCRRRIDLARYHRNKGVKA